jgi:anti-sigma-K factor RskA
MSGADDEREMLAAEYALGCLEASEMRDVEAMAVRDPVIRQAVEAWGLRLAPLVVLAREVTPPESLWQRLQTAIDGASVVPMRPRLWRRPAIWRVTTASALALAAAFAGAFFLRPAPVTYVAALVPVAGPAPAFIVRSAANRALVVSPVTSVSVAAGRDLELWALPSGAQRPISLGVLPAAGRVVPASPEWTQPRTQILVSLEPVGGSPTGQPTGPVLWGGTLD